MLNLAVRIAFVCIAIALLLNFWRLIRGPSLPDRILALDTMYINTVALLVLFGIYQGLTVFFEAALIIGMLGFAATVALAKFLMRGEVIE